LASWAGSAAGGIARRVVKPDEEKARAAPLHGVSRVGNLEGGLSVHTSSSRTRPAAVREDFSFRREEGGRRLGSANISKSSVSLLVFKNATPFALDDDSWWAIT
jgi:hypothetical protein